MWRAAFNYLHFFLMFLIYVNIYLLHRSVHMSALFPSNNFWTIWLTFTKLGMIIMPLQVTCMSCPIFYRCVTSFPLPISSCVAILTIWVLSMQDSFSEVCHSVFRSTETQINYPIVERPRNVDSRIGKSLGVRELWDWRMMMKMWYKSTGEADLCCTYCYIRIQLCCCLKYSYL